MMIQYSRVLRTVFDKKFDHNEFEEKRDLLILKIVNKGTFKLSGVFSASVLDISDTKSKMIIEH